MNLSVRSKIFACCTAAVAAVTGLVVGVAVTAGAARPAAADAASGSIVEEFGYPNAAEIFAKANVQLISGDGHIIYADCSTAPVDNIGVLKVWTTDETIGADGVGRVCFKVTAPTGWLNLKVPGVYEVRGDGQRVGTGHDVSADLTNDAGEDIHVEVDPDGSTQVGQGADPHASPTMLLRLIVSG